MVSKRPTKLSKSSLSPNRGTKQKKDVTSSRHERGSENGNSDSKNRDSKKQVKKQGFTEYSTYIRRLMKHVRPESSLSKRALTIFNCFAVDLIERIAVEAGRLAEYGVNKRTMYANDVRTAVKLILKGELQRHSIHEGERAVRAYIDQFKKQQQKYHRDL